MQGPFRQPTDCGSYEFKLSPILALASSRILLSSSFLRPLKAALYTKQCAVHSATMKERLLAQWNKGDTVGPKKIGMLGPCMI